jgi:hypothetical protein
MNKTVLKAFVSRAKQAKSLTFGFDRARPQYTQPISFILSFFTTSSKHFSDG